MRHRRAMSGRNASTDTLAALAGGMLATYLLHRAQRTGMRAAKAEGLVGLASVAGVMFGRGVVCSVATGALAANAGVVALRWMKVWIERRQGAPIPEARNAVSVEERLSVDEEFDEARLQVLADQDDEEEMALDEARQAILDSEVVTTTPLAQITPVQIAVPRDEVDAAGNWLGAAGGGS